MGRFVSPVPAWLLAFVLLGLSSGLYASATPAQPWAPSTLSWAGVQRARLDRLSNVMLLLANTPSAVDTLLSAHLQRRSQYLADDLAILLGVHSPHKVVSRDAATAQSPAAHGYEVHQPQPLGSLKPSRLRQLLQLSSSSQSSQVNVGLLTSSSVRKTQLTDPEKGLHAVSTDESTVSIPLDRDMLNTVARSSGLAAMGDKLLAAFSAFSPETIGDAAATSAPAVISMDGEQQEQQPMERLQPSLRIIGGVAAPIDRKYVCALRTGRGPQDSLFCGCSLISRSVVLTAAHCLANPDLRTPWVDIGRYYQQQPNNTLTNNYDRIKCVAGVVHQSYSDSTAQNDLALCFLESASRFAPVKLGDTANTKLTSGQQLTVMGWGATTEGGSQAAALMTVDVATTDVNTCRGVYGNRIDGDTQICAGVPEGGKDACQGDSGGPLIIRGTSAAEDVQVGIVSFGIGCGRPNVPGVYTDVRAYRQWVAEQMLARGVSYAPVTDGFTASAAVVDQTAACACTTDGKSGSTLLGANLAGCSQHGLNMGDTEFYCYVQGGRDCTAATPSDAYPGAAWLDCSPQVAKTEAPAPQQAPASPPAPKPAFPNQSLATMPSNELLANLMASALAGAATRDEPANQLSAVNGTADGRNGSVASNGTANVVTRRAAQPAVLG